VSAHDSLGSNLVVQVKQNQVMRVLPLENDSINECWLSDRDRFAYEGLESSQRLLKPMLRQDGAWKEVDWQVALQYAAHALSSVRNSHGAASLGALATPQASIEELSLLARLMRGLGSENIDFRARVADPSLASRLQGAPWLGMPIEAVGALDRVLLVGSFLRKDHPLLAARLRAAAKRGAKVGVLHAAHDDLLMPIAARSAVRASGWARALAAVRVALLRARGDALPSDLAGIEPDAQSTALAALLADGQRKAVFLGNAVGHLSDAADVAAQAQALADAAGATLGWLVEGANGTGGYLAGAVPGAGGLDANAMVQTPRRAYVLLGMEPGFDHAHPAAAMSAMGAADTVIALTAYASDELLQTADCLLPIAPFTETAGSFVNCAGTLQTFTGVVRCAGDSRPAWKVLRVLGNLLELTGFDQDSTDQVRAAALPAELVAGLSKSIRAGAQGAPMAAASADQLERIADVPVYFSDPIVRRAASLQQTTDADAPAARINAATLAKLGLQSGQSVRVTQGAAASAAQAVVSVVLDDGVADGVVRLAAAHTLTSTLAAMVGPIRLERV